MSDSSESSPPTSPGLDRFGENLTQAAREGKLDLVIGREKEAERVLEVLSRRTPHNPVLVGDPGVGKTAVVRGLAQKIARGRVPERWKDVQLYILDLRMIGAAGSGDQVDAQRLEEFLNEIRTRGDIILFIDDIHTMVGAGTGEGPIDAVSLLKRMLARGELHIIGATTLGEYRSHLETDAALERSFRLIEVTEPTIAHTIEILKSLRDSYESHHRVSITDGALVAAVVLGDSYIRDRFLPGKAIDLMDDAAARLRTHGVTGSPELREFDEKIAEVRREKESAIDSHDFERGAALRNNEKQLIEKKYAKEKDLEADYIPSLNEEPIFEILAVSTGVSVLEIRESYEEIRESYEEILSPREADDRSDVGIAEAYILLNDQPVDGAEGDLLGSSEVAAGIASMLSASRPAAPLVVAVDAGWGMGKSTLLRQIESQLPGRPSVIPVRFNAWTAQGENVLEGLIKSVLVELDSRIVRRFARKLGRQRSVLLIGRLGFAIIARFFGLSRLVDELWSQLEVNAKTRNEMRDVIHNMLTAWVSANDRDPGRTLVVFIDDLDRCSDDVIVKVCEAVKLYLDAPGLIFVIACDLSVLARGVSRSVPDATSQGRAYLEKIVQVAYRLPPPEQAQIRQLIRGIVQQSGTTNLIDDNVTEIIAKWAGRNPRRIKRIVNSLVLEHRLNPAWRQAPLGSAQLVRGILLQHLYAPFYDMLVAEESGEDPIADFLDYADVCAKAGDPPPAGHPWWSIASRTFQKHGIPAPKRSPGTGQTLLGELERLEAKIPEELQAFARDTSFVALLRGMGGKEIRHALRAQLITRPLGAELLFDER